MAVMKKVMHSDAGHGWLAVKLGELKMMGIEAEISNARMSKAKRHTLKKMLMQ